jgi:hypothetical protein
MAFFSCGSFSGYGVRGQKYVKKHENRNNKAIIIAFYQ